MSIFCPKCGTQLPDGAFACSQCGTPIGGQAPQQPQPAPQPVQQAPQPVQPAPQPMPQQPVYQAPVDPNQVPPQGYPQQPYPPQGYPQQPMYGYPGYPVPAPAPKGPAPDLNFGAFFKELFSNPAEAVSSRAKNIFWLMGLISIGAFILFEFIKVFIEIDYKTASYAFCTLLTEAFGFASLILLIMIFTMAFKIKKLDFVSSLALGGLAFIFAFPCDLVAYLNDKLYRAMDMNFFSISSSILTITAAFAAIALYHYAANNNEAPEKKASPVFFTILTLLCYNVCYQFWSWMFIKIFFS